MASAESQSNFENKINVLSKAAKLTKNLRQSEQAAVIGLLKLDPKNIEDERTRLQIIGVKQSLTENIKNNNFDHSMLETVKAIYSQHASKQGGRRKRKKSRKTKEKQRRVVVKVVEKRELKKRHYVENEKELAVKDKLDYILCIYMKINFLIFTITAFLVANAYYDGKFTKMFHIKKKYIQMAMYAFSGFSLYLFIKKSPIKSRGLLVHANNIIKHMPVDRNTKDLLTPLFDFSNLNDKMNNLGVAQNNAITPQMKRMLNSV